MDDAVYEFIVVGNYLYKVNSVTGEAWRVETLEVAWTKIKETPFGGGV